MKEADRKAQRDIPGLRLRLSRLLDLVMKILKEPHETPEDDPFRLMGLCFLGRQAEHAKTVILLIDNNREIDAQLIGRSMIEGLAQLLWAAGDPQKRALRWRTFVFIELWRQIQRLEESNEPVDENFSRKVQQGLAQYGKLHFRKKAKKHKTNNIALPKDPFCDNWRGVDFYSVFKEIEGIDMYRQIYQPFAAWHHWNPASFSKVIVQDGFNRIFSYGSFSTAALVLSCSFQSLWRTALLVSNYLKLNFGEKLMKVHNELIAWHKYNGQNRIDNEEKMQ